MRKRVETNPKNIFITRIYDVAVVEGRWLCKPGGTYGDIGDFYFFKGSA
jgi:hypothetical protein